MKPPIPLAEAQGRLLALARPLPDESIAVDAAAGRYLAHPLTARRTQPPADLSAMDGYAIAGSGPWQVIGESRAGAPFTRPITAGQAVRISTGAFMPKGGDTVLLQENSLRTGDAVALTGAMPEEGRHIRRAGFDFREGECLLSAGTFLGPAQIALALSAGHRTVRVARKPVVTIIDSGDELSADPENCPPHRIPASNGAMLAAMMALIPCKIIWIGPIADDLDALRDAFKEAEGSDLVVTSGGASVGDHDLIRPALTSIGAQIDFWRVAIKPGKPLMIATRGRQIFLGLPGNPVSSFATAFLFMLPLLRQMSGASNAFARPLMRPALVDLPPVGPRREFLRAVDDGAGVKPLEEQDSSALRALARTNALIERPEHSCEVKAGTDVPVYLLQNG